MIRFARPDHRETLHLVGVWLKRIGTSQRLQHAIKIIFTAMPIDKAYAESEVVHTVESHNKKSAIDGTIDIDRSRQVVMSYIPG